MNLEAVLLHRVTWLLGGGLVTIIVAYFTFSRDILAQLNFIKGQNAFLLQRFYLLDKMHDKLTGMDKDQERIKYDLNNSWKAIRTLTGGENGASSHSSPG